MSSPAPQEEVFEYVFEQEVQAAKLDRYFALSDRLHELVKLQPGFIELERHPVVEQGAVRRFQTTLKFDSAEHCISWLDNPERRRLLNQEEEESGFAFRGHGNWDGYSRWLTRRLTVEPAKWKVNLLVLLTLYPTAMLLTPLLHMIFKGMGLPAMMLISNILCVAATSWVLVPFASRFYLGWLQGDLKPLGRFLAILSLIALFVLLFFVFQALPAGFWN